MVSNVNRLNYLFHYRAVTEMDDIDYSSRGDFLTGIHDDSRSRSLESYAEREPRAKVLDSASAAIVYELEFEGQEIRVRLEYDDETVGVDMENNGKRSEFIRQLSEALGEDVELEKREQPPQL